MAKCFNCGVEAGDAIFKAKNGMDYCAVCYIKKIGPLPGTEVPVPKSRMIHIDAWAILAILAMVLLPLIGYFVYSKNEKAKAEDLARQERLAKEDAEREKQRRREEVEREVLLEEKRAAEQKAAALKAATTAKAEAERLRLEMEAMEAKRKVEQEAIQKADQELQRKQAAQAAQEAEKMVKDEQEWQKKAVELKETARLQEVEKFKGTYKTNFYRVSQLEGLLTDENFRLLAAQNRLKAATKDKDDSRAAALKVLQDLAKYYKIYLSTRDNTRRTTNRTTVVEGDRTVNTTTYTTNFERDPWEEYESLKPEIEQKITSKAFVADESSALAMGRLKNKFEAAKTEIERCNQMVTKSSQEAANLQDQVAQAKIVLDEAKGVLERNGVRPDEIKLAPAKSKELDPAALAGLPVYTLRDGRKIRAVTTVDSGDIFSIKDETGKIHTIKKEDVVEIVKPK